MNKKQFILDSNSLKIKEILNKDFLEVELYAISEGENINGSNFTLNSMEKSIPTFYNKFILGYFNTQGGTQEEGVFEEHNSDIRYDQEYDEYYYSYTSPNAEKALGIIRESDKIEIVEYKGKKWIKLTAAILTKYNREAVKHLLKSKRKRKISVEITIDKYHTDENGIEIIEEFTLDGITILGNRKNSNILCEEGIKGAELRILNFLETEVFNTQKKALSFAYSNLDAENDNEHKDEIEMIKNQEEMEGKTMINEEKEKYEEAVSEDVYDNKSQNIDAQDSKEDKTNTEEKECKCSENNNDVEEAENNNQDNFNDNNDCEGDTDCKEEVDNKEKKEEDYGCDSEDNNDNNEEEKEAKKEEDSKKIEEPKDCNDREEECDFESNQGVDGEVFLVECSFGRINCENAEIRDNLQSVFTKYEQLQKDYEEIQAQYNALKKETNNAKLLQFGLSLINSETILTTEEATNIKDIYTNKCNESEFVSEEQVQEYLIAQFASVVYNKAKSNKINEQKEFSAKIPFVGTESKKEEVDTFVQMKNILKL